MLRQQRDLVGVEVNAMGANQAGAEQAKAAQPFDGAHSEEAQAVVNFLFCFMQMEMDW